MTFLKFTWLAWSVAIVWFSLLFALAVACGGGQANDDALLQAYGECLYENGVAELAGLSSVDETVARLRANVRNGSQTPAEFQRAYDKSCKG